MRCSKSCRRTPTVPRIRWGGARSAGRAATAAWPATPKEGTALRRLGSEANWLKVLADKKQEVPWIQAKRSRRRNRTTKAAEIAAKRAEVGRMCAPSRTEP